MRTRWLLTAALAWTLAAPAMHAQSGTAARVDIHIAWTSQHFGAGGIDAQIKTPTGGADAFGQKWNHEITLAVPGTEIGKGGGDRR